MNYIDKIEQKIVWLSSKLRKCRSIVKYKKKLLRQEYHILPGESYADRILLDDVQGNAAISKFILSNGGHCIGKLGDVELFNTLDYMIRGTPGKLNKWRLQNNAGFFTDKTDDADFLRFCELYLDSVRQMDLIGVWFNPGEDYVISQASESAKVSDLKCLEPYLFSAPWSASLQGKKVLVVSPFAELISKQYENREHLFEDSSVLPEFELTTIQAVQTIGSLRDQRFISWFDALDYMKCQISKCDFDVALIGCGAYSLPLAAYVKSLGKTAIHTGGATQIMFGIKGKRWDNISNINRFYNEYWIRPGQSENHSKATTATADYW